MQVRNIKSSDNMIEIAKVYIDSFKNTYKGFVSEDRLNLMTQDNWFENIHDYRDFFVLIDQDAIIGMASIMDDEIERIYLRYDYLDQGYGNLLLNAMVIELTERGYDEICLWDLKENQRATYFYQKNDFVETDQTRNFLYDKDNLKEVKFVLNLKHD
ncbi:MAG TPA: GNAT family N-acetyltransferase [Erysipelothrix sp.]|nr:GNAT family N-acetyltransferase [Erysipelothrix sp.]